MSKLTCLQIYTKITSNVPSWPAGGRLATALSVSALDGPVTLIAIAYKESLFDAAAVNPGGATGLFQFRPGTADDVQDRVVKHFVADGSQIPNVPGGQRFVDHRTDADASCFCAWAYLLDRIAYAGNKLKEGIIAFGDQTTDYGTQVLAAVGAIQKIAGVPANQSTDPGKLLQAVTNNCPAIQDALNGIYGY